MGGGWRVEKRELEGRGGHGPDLGEGEEIWTLSQSTGEPTEGFQTGWLRIRSAARKDHSDAVEMIKGEGQDRRDADL